MKFGAEYKIRFGYGAAFFLLLIAFSYSVFTTDQLLFHIKSVAKTNRLLHNLGALRIQVKDLDASLSNNTFQDSLTSGGYYMQSFNSIDSISALLQRDYHDEYISSTRLHEIEKLLNVAKDSILSQYRYAADSKYSFTNRYILDDQKMINMAVSKITDMQVAEKALLTLRSRGLDDFSGSMKGINIAILLLALLLAGYSWLVYNNENTAKRNANMLNNAYSRELEQKVAELTTANSELTKLRSLQKFTATGRIARMIAHEVRNPLTNINLSCDQLDDLTGENEQADMLLKTILRSSNRINQLVSELLNATKMDELKIQKISINKLLDETLEIAGDRIVLEQIRLIKNYDLKICDVEVDPDKMKIAFLNIILNAVEAMTAGAGVLELRTETRDKQCVVIISDNGHGIDKDALDKIFEPYYTGKSKGTGLGLTNTQNIILSHKGSINVESTLGVGTVFIIALEFAKIS